MEVESSVVSKRHAPSCFKVKVLGCGASGGVPVLKYGWGKCDPKNPKNFRLRSSIIIESETTTLLIDTSPDLRQQLLNYGSYKIDGIIFTHFHFDHVGGLNELRPVFFETGKTLNVYSDRKTLEEIKTSSPFLFSDSGCNLYKSYLTACEVKREFQVGDISGIVFPQDHGFCSTLGIRVGDFAYSTDVVNLPNEAFEALSGVKTWIVDCLSEEEKPTHANLSKVLEWIHIIKPQMTYLTHMDLTMDYETLVNKLPKNIRPAYDGLQVWQTYPIGES